MFSSDKEKSTSSQVQVFEKTTKPVVVVETKTIESTEKSPVTKKSLLKKWGWILIALYLILSSVQLILLSRQQMEIEIQVQELSHLIQNSCQTF